MEVDPHNYDDISVNEKDVPNIVLSYLIHNCYEESAESFIAGAGTTRPTDYLDNMEKRKKIIHYAMEGNALEAIELTEQLTPEILEKNKDLLFDLLSLHFVELVRSRKCTEALEFAQTKLSPFGKEAKYMEKLEDFMALLAYKEPENSPMFHLLSLDYRQEFADNLNRTILAYFNLPSYTAMERLVSLFSFTLSLFFISKMGSLEVAERTTVGLAATDPSGILTPYTYALRNTGPDDVYIKIYYCGVCHSDLHQIKNDLGMSNYPMVPGHEVVGEVLEVGSNVSRFSVGEIVGVGLLVGCCKNCRACDSDIEQYCNKKIWSYNDVYTDGKITQGGFAETTVVEQKFVVKIPEGLAPEQAAPLLCAGVTVYSPLAHFGLKQSGLRGGILGLGGVGHMGVKVAKALGHHVTVISSSDKKKKEAIEDLGADNYVVSSDTTAMQEIADSLDYIIDTVPVGHPLEPYLALLKVDGKLILMGVINTPLQFITPMVMLGRKTITGSFVGSVKETEEMLEFWKEKGLTSMIEIVKMDYINKAFERLEKNDVRYRFVVDVKGSKLEQ